MGAAIAALELPGVHIEDVRFVGRSAHADQADRAVRLARAPIALVLVPEQAVGVARQDKESRSPLFIAGTLFFQRARVAGVFAFILSHSLVWGG